MIRYGFNGTNTAKVLNSQVRGLLGDIINESSLDTLVYRLRNDKYDGAMPLDEIANVIALHHTLLSQGKILEVIYNFDTRNQVSLYENFYAFLQLLEEGVYISAVEMGNEEWADVAGHNGSWDIFQSKFQPILNELNLLGWEGKILFPITQNNPRFTEWDNKGINFINSNNQYEPAIHLYFNKIDAPIIGDLDREDLPKSDFSKDVYIEDKDKFYETLCNQIIASNLLERNISFVNERMPGKKIWFTEYGPAVNAGGLQNTLGYHMSEFKVLMDSWMYQDTIAVMCKHNGPTTPLTGIISKKVKFDAKEEEFIPRLSFHTMKLFLSKIGKENYIPFYNSTRNMVEVDVDVDELTFINGENWYSSSGRCGWWGEGSIGYHEIDMIKVEKNSLNYLPLSYGFYHFKDEVEGCTDSKALNFNPLATIDDGSCVYQPKPSSRPKWWNKLKEIFGWTS